MEAKGIHEQAEKRSIVYDRQFRKGGPLDYDMTKHEAINAAMDRLRAQVQAFDDVVGQIDGHKRPDKPEAQVAEESLAELLQTLPFGLLDVANSIDRLMERLVTALVWMKTGHPDLDGESQVSSNDDLPF